jgi:hypothetical protein
MNKIVVIALSFLIGTHSAHALCSSGTRSLVEKFLAFEAQGYRLGSRGHEAIWELTTEGETPEDPIVLTKDGSITSSRPLPNGCQYTIRFQILGSFSERPQGGLSFAQRSTNEVQTIKVLCNRECKVSIASDDFKFGPHPGKAPTISWLSTLRSIQTTESGKADYQKLIHQIDSLN